MGVCRYADGNGVMARELPGVSLPPDLTRTPTPVTLTFVATHVPGAPRARGFTHFRGQVDMVPSRPDGYLTTPEAAALVGVKPWLIRKWRQRGYLAPQGLDERGNPLHTAEAVRAAERLVRAHGIEASGIDPRLLRKPPPLAA